MRKLWILLIIIVPLCFVTGCNKQVDGPNGNGGNGGSQVGDDKTFEATEGGVSFEATVENKGENSELTITATNKGNTPVTIKELTVTFEFEAEDQGNHSFILDFDKTLGTEEPQSVSSITFSFPQELGLEDASNIKVEFK